VKRGGRLVNRAYTAGNMVRVLVSAFVILPLAGLLGTRASAQVVAYPSPLIREQRTVVVNGATEIWQLRWKSAPKPVCGAEDMSETIGCHCWGFAYGEGGEMDLVRMRDGREMERLSITAMFEETDRERIAVIQRWPDSLDDQEQAADRSDWPSVVAKRAPVTIMNLRDYEHDGQPDQFYLQTSAGPCGIRAGVVIGVSKRNPKLHAISTVLHPDKPLIMRNIVWRGLRLSRGVAETLELTCGEKGADFAIRVRLTWTPKGLTGLRRTLGCPLERPLIREEPF
jgi:hypothetical protein